MSDVLTFQLVIAALHLSVPLILAALGGLLSERSGVVNIALEGQMLTGAFAGVLATWLTSNLFVGLAAALAAGALAGLLHAWFAVTLGANQIVAATAINLVALGLTAALIPAIWGKPGTSPNVGVFTAIDLPVLASLPGWFGRLARSLNLLDLLALAAVPAIAVLLARTRFGLRLRASGESPAAALSVGVSVVRIRYVAVVLSGVLAAAGGAYLSLAEVGVFQRGMTQGRGFLALAALIFGKWRPVPVLGACLLFGAADAFQLRAQAAGVDLPTELLLALPYLVALVALAGFVGRAHPPAALGRPLLRD
jgi:simple sugar transport system permease protein